MDGATYKANVQTHSGGVGRNIADGLSKLTGKSIFLSAVGNDQNGFLIKKMMPTECLTNFITDSQVSTANCSVILDKCGDSKLLVGNMDIHSKITPEFVMKNKKAIENAPIVVIDGNLSLETIEAIYKINEKERKPIFFEPTDMSIAGKPFQIHSKYKYYIKFISPNLYELRTIAQSLGFLHAMETEKSIDELTKEQIFIEVKNLSKFVINYVDNIIVTLGNYGIITVSKHESDNKYFSKDKIYISNSSHDLNGRYYPARDVKYIKNVSGAGDSFVSGFIAAALNSKSEAVCINVGLEAASKALQSSGAVPQTYFEDNHKCWDDAAHYVHIF